MIPPGVAQLFAWNYLLLQLVMSELALVISDISGHTRDT